MNTEEGSSDDSELENESGVRKRKKQGDNAKKRQKTQGLYSQPTAEELNQFRETENLFNSNLFRLQIEELLSEINVKAKHRTRFNAWIEVFKRDITLISQYDNSMKFKNALRNNPTSLFTADVEMKFIRPLSAFTFGDYANCVSDNEIKLNANISVVIPRGTFYEKDYRNNKYTTKKYRYLIYLLHSISLFKSVAKVEVSCEYGLEWAPKLIITPDYSDKVRVHLFAVPESGTFPLNRFLPDQNNLKIPELIDAPSALYNSVILRDLTLQSNNEAICNSLIGMTNVHDGIKLLITWLKQRSLNSAYNAFTNELVVNIVVYLLINKKINKHMSSYQVVRMFLSFLSGMDDFLSMKTDFKPETEDLFKRCFTFTLLDFSGALNCAAFLDEDVLLKIKREAEIALIGLDGDRFTTFAALYMRNIPYSLQYDCLVKIPIDTKTFFEKSTADEHKKFHLFQNELIINCVKKYLKKGLTNRVLQVIPILSHNLGQDIILFGINLNPAQIMSVVEKGPSPSEPGVDEFKSFWGRLSELKRFKDSSVHEAVYFEGSETIQDKRLIFKRIIEFVLKEKLGVDCKINGDEMEAVLKVQSAVTPSPIGSNEEATLSIKSSYFKLTRLLRELNMPVPITACQGISDVFSYTEPFPELARNRKCMKGMSENENYLMFDQNSQLKIAPLLCSPMECVIQLALHSKWPRNLKALRAMMEMFYFEIAKLLKDEHNIMSIVEKEYMDVYYDGFVFRLRLHQPKEITLMKEGITDNGVAYYKDTEASLHKEKRFEVLPKIVGALNGVHQECSSFGPSTSLIKCWLRSQMLSDHHICDTAINLLNASLYLNPIPFDPAVLPQVAFLRFLKFISEHNFDDEPIIVNFNNELSAEKLNEIETSFMQTRQNFSPLFILTPYDAGKSVFTKCSPSKETLCRIKSLAKESYEYMLQFIHGNALLKFKACFIANLEGYDQIIYIKSNMIPKRSHESNIIHKFDADKNLRIPIVDFNPVDLYVKELEDNYSEYALFFYNIFNPSSICILWKKEWLENVDFKVSNVYGRKRTTDRKLMPNKKALLEDFQILGNGLIDKIVECK